MKQLFFLLAGLLSLGHLAAEPLGIDFLGRYTDGIVRCIRE